MGLAVVVAIAVGCARQVMIRVAKNTLKDNTQGSKSIHFFPEGDSDEDFLKALATALEAGVAWSRGE